MPLQIIRADFAFIQTFLSANCHADTRGVQNHCDTVSEAIIGLRTNASIDDH